MTDKELRKLSKTELLWIIRDQEAEILELKERLSDLAGSENVEDAECCESDENSAEVDADDKSGSTDA